jgi:hypothetical protein
MTSYSKESFAILIVSDAFVEFSLVVEIDLFVEEHPIIKASITKK